MQPQNETEEKPDSSDDEQDYDVIARSLRQAIDEDRIEFQEGQLSSSVSTSLDSGQEEAESPLNRSGDLDSFRALVEEPYVKSIATLSMVDFDHDPHQTRLPEEDQAAKKKGAPKIEPPRDVQVDGLFPLFFFFLSVPLFLVSIWLLP